MSCHGGEVGFEGEGVVVIPPPTHTKHVSKLKVGEARLFDNVKPVDQSPTNL